MNVREALTDIEVIRSQIARAGVFRGCRSATVAFSGVLALATALAQHVLVASPAQQTTAYLALWLSAAAVSLGVTAVEMTYRCQRACSPLVLRMTWQAAEQFLPCVAAGAALTAILTATCRESLWMLPGLWSILFGLGVFALSRLLPPAIFWVALFYLAAGCCCLLWTRGEYAFSPWAMAGSFGIGQFMTAAIFYWQIEKDHG